MSCGLRHHIKVEPKVTQFFCQKLLLLNSFLFMVIYNESILTQRRRISNRKIKDMDGNGLRRVVVMMMVLTMFGRAAMGANGHPPILPILPDSSIFVNIYVKCYVDCIEDCEIDYLIYYT